MAMDRNSSFTAVCAFSASWCDDPRSAAATDRKCAGSVRNRFTDVVALRSLQAATHLSSSAGFAASAFFAGSHSLGMESGNRFMTPSVAHLAAALTLLYLCRHMRRHCSTSLTKDGCDGWSAPGPPR